MPMRRLIVTLLCGLMLAPTAFAASRAAGDGVLELRAVYGTVVVGSTAQPAKGALWGQMDKGVIKVTDPVVGDGQVYVSGYESKTVNPDLPNVVVYSGKDLHFRVTGGKYKLFFRGSGLDFTAVGVGTALLNGDDSAIDTGDYARNGGKWFNVPVTPTVITFGDQPTQ